MEKYDLHAHLFSNWKKGKYSLEKAPRTPEYILDTINKKGLDGMVLTNFGDADGLKTAYEELAASSYDGESLGKYKLVRELDNALVFENGEREFKIIKGHEISTLAGHVVAIGLKKGFFVEERRNLDSTLKKVRANRGISNADHYSGFMGIGIDKLMQYSKLLDCFEGINQNYVHEILKFKLGLNPSLDELNQIKSLTGLNWIAVSDCHNRKDLGNGHIEINENLDFSSGDNLTEHLKDVLKQGRFRPINGQPNSLRSVLGHAFITTYDGKIRTRMGWGDFQVG